MISGFELPIPTADARSIPADLTRDGLVLLEGFLDAPVELFEQLKTSVDWDARFASRGVASYGRPYRYAGNRFEERPIPPMFDELLGNVNTKFGDRPNNVLLNYYSNARSRIGMHPDDPAQLEPGSHVFVASLGAPRLMTFRSIESRSRRVDVELASGTLLVMSREFQFNWHHGIRPQAFKGERISVTLRSVPPVS